MRYSILLATLCSLALPTLAWAQSDSTAVAATRAENQQSYVVQLTEFRLKPSVDPELTAGEIVARFAGLKDGDKIQLVETVRMSTLSGSKSMVQFTKQSAVTVGSVSTGRGPATKQTRTEQVGTMLQVTATPRAGKVHVEISYESSRFEGKGTEDSRPDIVTTLVNSTHLVELGKPTLIAGTSAGETSFVMLSIGL